MLLSHWDDSVRVRSTVQVMEEIWNLTPRHAQPLNQIYKFCTREFVPDSCTYAKFHHNASRGSHPHMHEIVWTRILVLFVSKEVSK